MLLIAGTSVVVLAAGMAAAMTIMPLLVMMAAHNIGMKNQFSTKQRRNAIVSRTRNAGIQRNSRIRQRIFCACANTAAD